MTVSQCCLAGGQQIVFYNGVFQYAASVRHHRLLVGLQKPLKLRQLGPLDQPGREKVYKC